jgi:hypothetical protein
MVRKALSTKKTEVNTHVMRKALSTKKTEGVDENITKARRSAYSLFGCGFHGHNGLDPESLNLECGRSWVPVLVGQNKDCICGVLLHAIVW